MSQIAKGSPADRREFGRRTTSWHAWIICPNRPKIACLVRNVSPAGARLELEVPVWLPWNLRLVVDAYRLEFECEVRYRRPNAIGVFFLSASEEWRRTGGQPTLDGLRTWKPGGALSSQRHTVR